MSKDNKERGVIGDTSICGVELVEPQSHGGHRAWGVESPSCRGAGGTGHGDAAGHVACSGATAAGRRGQRKYWRRQRSEQVGFLMVPVVS